MKKILSIISAGLLVVLAASCNKDEKATFDPSDVTAPVLGTVNVGTDVVVNYTPAVFSMDFNKDMPTYHTLGMIAVNDEKCDVTLSNAKDSGTSLKLSGKNMTAALQLRGFAIGEQVKVTVVVRASIQDPSKGVTNGYVDSEDSYDFTWTLKEDKPGNDPYAGWEASTWGVTGSIASAGINWDKDIEMVTDGTWHVAKGVVLTTSDQFKFRKDGGWTDNFGAGPDISEEPYAVTIDAEQPAGAGGKNLCVAEDGTYDLFINPDAQIYKVIVTGSNAGPADPYADWELSTEWSVIGSIASTGNSWGQDEPMLTDGTWYVCRGIELATTDQFKFRKDHDWATNFGAASSITEEPYVVTLGEELEAGAGGKNLAVPADGKYDLLLNPDAGVYKIIEAQEAVAADFYAGFEDTEVWSVIGSIASTGNGWNQDEPMVTDGTWYVCRGIELATTDQFKFRKDHDWGTNFGAASSITDEPYVVTLGEEQEAGAGGKNLAVPEDGTYDLLVNPDAAVYKIIKTGDDPEL